MRLLLTLACTLILLPPAHAADPQPLLVGQSSIDITPPIGYRMAGYFYERRSTAVHDPLLAKTLVFKQADTAFALTVCDLCHISPAVVAQARALASKQTGIPPDHIAISATHTHTGPDYFGVLRDHLHRLALATHGKDPAEEIDYPNVLAEKIATGIAEAAKSAAPANLKIGAGKQNNLAFNRRFFMKDGSVGWNAGKKNPNIVKPAGPIDPEISILAINRAEGSPTAVLTSFALHADTVGGTEYSADYPHYLEQTLRGWLKAPELLSVFAQGTSGDVNHVDVSTDKPQKGHEEAARIGRELGDNVFSAMLTLKEVAHPRLTVATTRVDLPVQQYTPEEVANARSLFNKIQERKLPFLVGVKATKIVKIYDRYLGHPIPAQIQAFRIADDTAILTLPGEVFVELGLAIKQQSPFKHTILIELANDSFGYIPTRRAYEEGNYEPTNSTVQSGSGEKLVEAAVALLRRL
jgi:hypothetical protein